MKQPNQNIFDICPDCINTRAKLKSFLSDVFLDEKLAINIILSAYDMGIVSKLSTQNNIDSVFFIKCQKELMNNFGLTEKNAKDSLMFWINYYAKPILNSNVNFDVSSIEPNADETNDSSTASKKTSLKYNPVYTPSDSLVDIFYLGEDEKLPKSVIRIAYHFDTNISVSDFRANIRKKYYTDEESDHTYIDVLGEFIGTKDAKSNVLMAVVVHNEKGYPLGASTVYFTPQEFKKKCHFDFDILIPSYEFISDVTFNFSYHPTFIN